MIVAEAFNAVARGQVSLRLAALGQPKIVKTEIGGDMRLVVAGKQRLCLGRVGPFGKAFTPPEIVLGDGMELRQVECDRPGVQHDGSHAPGL